MCTRGNLAPLTAFHARSISLGLARDKSTNDGNVSIVKDFISNNIGNLFDSIKVIGRGNGKACFNNVDTEFGQHLCNFQLFRRRQAWLREIVRHLAASYQRFERSRDRQSHPECTLDEVFVRRGVLYFVVGHFVVMQCLMERHERMRYSASSGMKRGRSQGSSRFARCWACWVQRLAKKRPREPRPWRASRGFSYCLIKWF